MKIWYVLLIFGLWLIQAATLATPVLAGKDSPTSIDEKIKQEQQTLDQLRREIEQKQRKADSAGEQRESVLHVIQKLDDKLIIKRQQRYAVNRQLKQKDLELERISHQLDEVKARIRRRRGSILTRLRVQYMQGRLGYLKALLSSDSPSTLDRRFQYLSAISRREYALLEAHKEDVVRLEAIKQDQGKARREMFALKKRTDGKLREIDHLKREKRSFLAKVTRQKDAYERAVSELERSAARVDSLLKELEERRKLARLRPRRPDGGFRGVKGALPWPASGKVVSFFGRQKHPNFATYIDRKGIEIQAREGTEIRAVMDGTVAYADWLKGYGLVLILDHPNGFFSLYAHASKLLTAVGTRVQAGDVIGETGDTGMTGENTLYFELRDGAEPVDPLLWLAQRR